MSQDDLTPAEALEQLVESARRWFMENELLPEEGNAVVTTGHAAANFILVEENDLVEDPGVSIPQCLQALLASPEKFFVTELNHFSNTTLTADKLMRALLREYVAERLLELRDVQAEFARRDKSFRGGEALRLATAYIKEGPDFDRSSFSEALLQALTRTLYALRDSDKMLVSSAHERPRPALTDAAITLLAMRLRRAGADEGVA